MNIWHNFAMKRAPDFLTGPNRIDRARIPVRRRRTDMAVWVIRVDDEQAEEFALGNNCVIIGSGLGDIRGKSDAEVKAEAEKVYPNKTERGRAQKIGNVRRFVHCVKVGDRVILPLETMPDRAAIGEIVGCYRHDINGENRRKHRREVEWTIKNTQRPSGIRCQLTVHRYRGNIGDIG